MFIIKDWRSSSWSLVHFIISSSPADLYNMYWAILWMEGKTRWSLAFVHPTKSKQFIADLLWTPNTNPWSEKYLDQLQDPMVLLNPPEVPTSLPMSCHLVEDHQTTTTTTMSICRGQTTQVVGGKSDSLNNNSTGSSSSGVSSQSSSSSSSGLDTDSNLFSCLFTIKG